MKFFLEKQQKLFDFLCDVSFSFQEGLVKPSRAKSKLHLGAIAKTALRFSFLKFKARSDMESGHAADSVDDVQYEAPGGISIPNGNALNEEIRNCKEDEEQNTVLRNSIEGPSIEIDAPSSPEPDVEIEASRNCDKELSERLAGLETRVVMIERQLSQFRSTFDVQMKTMLDAVKNLKGLLEVKEVTSAQNTIARPERFEFQNGISEIDSMTSTL